jgi:hypothetical protein
MLLVYLFFFPVENVCHLVASTDNDTVKIVYLFGIVRHFNYDIQSSCFVHIISSDCVAR